MPLGRQHGWSIANQYTALTASIDLRAGPSATAAAPSSITSFARTGSASAHNRLLARRYVNRARTSSVNPATVSPARVPRPRHPAQRRLHVAGSARRNNSRAHRGSLQQVPGLDRPDNFLDFRFARHPQCPSAMPVAPCVPSMGCPLRLTSSPGTISPATASATRSGPARSAGTHGDAQQQSAARRSIKSHRLRLAGVSAVKVVGRDESASTTVAAGPRLSGRAGEPPREPTACGRSR